MDAVLVTGAGRGIGHALAAEAARRGRPVIGTLRGAAAEPLPAGVEAEPLDVADPASQAALAARLAGRPIGLLICNAGVLKGRGGLAADWPAEDWTESFLVNVAGVFWTVQALLPCLRLATRPVVAVISSQMGSSARARGNSYIYRATKAAAANLARNLAEELRPEGIAVGAWHPGWVRTDMGGRDADIGMAESAAALMDRFEGFGTADTGAFRDWTGADMPW